MTRLQFKQLRRRRSNKASTETKEPTTTKMRYQSYLIMTSFVVGILLCAIPRVLSLGSDCYTISGEDYRGNQDRIEIPTSAGSSTILDPTSCLPWNNSREFDKPRAKERGIGSHNFCRNPDGDVMPWCKVKADGSWGYCHLPSCQAPGYMGCFKDKGHPPALSGMFVKHVGKDNTVASCLEFCRGQGYKYAGVESGMACYCGNGGYQRYGKATHRGNHCTTKCFGDDSQACGGDGFMDVYKSHLGQCNGVTLDSHRDVIYNPGYPYKPVSADMATSVKASKRMVTQLQNDGDFKVKNNPGALKSLNADSCEWTVNVANAQDIQLIIRKIDRKLDLGGSILIKSVGDSSITVLLSSFQTSGGLNVGNNSDLISNQVSAKTREVTVTDSLKNPGEFDLKVSQIFENENSRNAREDNKNGDKESIIESSWTLPSASQQPLLTVSGGRFTVKFVRGAKMMAAAKEMLQPDYQRRSRSRKRLQEREWARFAIEYEASFPLGVSPPENNDAMNIQTQNTIKPDVTSKYSSPGSRRKNKPRKRPKSKPEQQHNNSEDTPRVVIRLNPIDTQSILNKILPEHFLKNKNDEKSDVPNNESEKNSSTSIQIDVEVIVDVVPDQSGKVKEKSENSSSLSEFTMPLLLAVLFITTAILVFAAVFLIFKKGSFFKNKSRKAMVVSLDDKSTGDEYPQKPDKMEGTEYYFAQENGSFSPSKRNSASIKTLIDILKHHPGMFQRSRCDADYKQVAQDSTNPPSSENNQQQHIPCPYCCNCQLNQEANNFCHHGKTTSKVSPPRPNGKNIRGLTVKAPKSKTLNISSGPPLSPITEVSSVASSTLSLSPITSPNSMTSLLPKGTQLKTQSNAKSVTWKLRSSSTSLKDDNVAMNEGETDPFLPAQLSDAESGIDESEVKTNSNNIKTKTPSIYKPVGKNNINVQHRKRYLGNTSCYDSGYATSNYEEDEEDRVYKNKVENTSLQTYKNNLKEDLLS